MSFLAAVIAGSFELVPWFRRLQVGQLYFAVLFPCVDPSGPLPFAVRPGAAQIHIYRLVVEGSRGIGRIKSLVVGESWAIAHGAILLGSLVSPPSLVSSPEV